MAESPVFQILLILVVIPLVVYIVKKYVDKAEATAKEAKEAAEQGLTKIQESADRNARELKVHMDQAITSLGNELDKKETEAFRRYLGYEEKLLGIEKRFGTLPDQFHPRREMDEILRSVRGTQDDIKTTVYEINKKSDKQQDDITHIRAWIDARKNLPD